MTKPPFKNLSLLGTIERVYPFPWYVAEQALTHDLEPILGVNMPRTLSVFHADSVSVYYDLAQFDKMGKMILHKVIAEPSFIDRVSKQISLLSGHLLEHCETIETIDLPQATDDDLLASFSEYCNRLRALRAWGWLPVILDGGNTAHLTSYLLQQVRISLPDKSESEMTAYYSILSSSAQISQVRAEELERLLLAGKITSHPAAKRIVTMIQKKQVTALQNIFPDVYQLLQQHVTEYGWLIFGYIGPPMTLAYLFDQLVSDFTLDNPEKERDKLHHITKSLQRKKERLINELRLPAFMQRLLADSASLMFLKDYRKGVYQRSYVHVDRLLDEIARRVGWSLHEIKYVTDSELPLLFEMKHNRQLKKRVRQRMGHCRMTTTRGTVWIDEDHHANEIIDPLTISDEAMSAFQTHQTLQGMVAYHGTASGTVKIVRYQQEVLKVAPGDILVSPSTNPDLISAMKRAAAIVTDRGGITSHAAIVARELQKPCVVGTRHATRLLKDGDQVIVDATSGIITIIL